MTVGISEVAIMVMFTPRNTETKYLSKSSHCSHLFWNINNQCKDLFMTDDHKADLVLSELTFKCSEYEVAPV